LSQEKSVLDGRLLELDQLVSQLLGLNETLVTQLSGKPMKAPAIGSSTKKTKKKTKTSDKSPQVVGASSVVSDGSKATKSSSRNPAPIKAPDVESLKSLNKLYSNMAKTLKRSGSPSKSRRSDEGRTSTRMSSKKAASRDNSLAPGESRGSELDGPRTTKEVRLPKANVAFDSDIEVDEMPSYLSHGSSRGTNYNSSSYTSDGSVTSNKELGTVIASLEEEFDGLNRQYRRLLSNVQASNTMPGPDGSEMLTAEHIQAQAEEIVNVIQKLHQKGEQLRLLKSPSARG
jgi:hypothetical protein